MVNQESDKGFLAEERSDEGFFFGVRRLAAAFLAAATRLSKNLMEERGSGFSSLRNTDN
jgi:hypothetical protein